MKRKTVAARLGESNEAAIRLADIAERKCTIKENYYAKKILIMEEQTVLLRNISTLFTDIHDKLT